MKPFQVVVASMLALIANPLNGYELGTHAAATQRGVERFASEQPTKFIELGLSMISGTTPGLSLGERYFDLGPLYSVPPQRDMTQFEKAVIAEVAPTISSSSALGWFMAGAIREDDVPLGPNPSDDPYGSTIRPRNHFYDPVLNRGLNTAFASGLRSPQWGIGAADPFKQPGIPQVGRANHFTVFDARESMFRALTLKARGQTGEWVTLPQWIDPSEIARQRAAYWATTFRALGDVVHLIQDMGQPQHTRNDAHGGIPGSGHASTYEAYIEARARRRTSFAVKWPEYTYVSIPLKALPFQLCPTGPASCTEYPTPKDFTQYSQFWSTAPGSVGSGRGLADFSNNGFFSAGTNLGGNPYASPPNSAGSYVVTSVPATYWDGQPASWSSLFGTATALVRLYSRPVIDNLNPRFSVTQAPLTSASVFDEFLRHSQLRETFHLSHENYDAQADLLLPRAVAYSAGLLEYFFRGSMEIGPPAAGFYGIVDHATLTGVDPQAGFRGFGKIKLKLRNTTPNAPGSTTPEPLANGSLFAVLKFHRNTCYVDNLDGELVQIAQAASCRSPVEEIVVSDPVNGASVPAATSFSPDGIEYTFSFPKQLPINAWDVVLQVVYRGKLGNEDDAVVVTTKDISEPTFVVVRNDTDYVAVNSVCYKPAQIAANDALWNALAAGCRLGSGSTRQVAPMCANVPLNLALMAISGSNLPVTVSWTRSLLVAGWIPPRRFGRVAILQDLGKTPDLHLVFNNYPLALAPGADTSLATDPYRVQADASRSVADVNVLSRGVRTWEGMSFAIDGTTGTAGAACTDAPLDALSGAERVPVGAVIIGW